jgi:hypothetical protein
MDPVNMQTFLPPLALFTSAISLKWKDIILAELIVQLDNRGGRNLRRFKKLNSFVQSYPSLARKLAARGSWCTDLCFLHVLMELESWLAMEILRELCASNCFCMLHNRC